MNNASGSNPHDDWDGIVAEIRDILGGTVCGLMAVYPQEAIRDALKLWANNDEIWAKMRHYAVFADQMMSVHDDAVSDAVEADKGKN